MSFLEELNKFNTYIKENNIEKIIEYYETQQTNFFNIVGYLCSKKENVTLLKYLESLNLDLNDKGHSILWNSLRAYKVKNSTYLIKHLEKDSKASVLCNNIFISIFLNNDNKPIKIFPLIFNKISENKFNEILDNHINKNRYVKEKLNELRTIYLDISLSKTIEKSTTKKLKI